VMGMTHVGQGVLVDDSLRALVQAGAIIPGVPLLDGQIQPASMDLRLGARAWRVQATQMPGMEKTVTEVVAPLVMYELDLAKPCMLERGAVYVMELQESVKLPPHLGATCSPKSSTGRLDIFVRVLTDRATTYDCLSAGYAGKLYVEVMPLTFSVVVRAGDRLTQLRVRPTGAGWLSDDELRQVNAATPLVPNQEDVHMEDGMWMSLDLHGEGKPTDIVGYKAKHHTQPIDLCRVQHYDWRQFWEPLTAKDCAPMILYPEEFYIFASAEKVSVPPTLAAELMAYDIRVGELRLHYAGFFDPGFGWDAEKSQSVGTTAVLEVRAHDVPCVLQHGQRIGRFMYERLNAAPHALYGAGIGSNYAGQRLKLAKQFIMDV
jgi:dCTP deaminase